MRYFTFYCNVLYINMGPHITPTPHKGVITIALTPLVEAIQNTVVQSILLNKPFGEELGRRGRRWAQQN